MPSSNLLKPIFNAALSGLMVSNVCGLNYSETPRPEIDNNRHQAQILTQNHNELSLEDFKSELAQTSPQNTNQIKDLIRRYIGETRNNLFDQHSYQDYRLNENRLKIYLNKINDISPHIANLFNDEREQRKILEHLYQIVLKDINNQHQEYYQEEASIDYLHKIGKDFAIVLNPELILSNPNSLLESQELPIFVFGEKKNIEANSLLGTIISQFEDSTSMNLAKFYVKLDLTNINYGGAEINGVAIINKAIIDDFVENNRFQYGSQLNDFLIFHELLGIHSQEGNTTDQELRQQKLSYYFQNEDGETYPIVSEFSLLTALSDNPRYENIQKEVINLLKDFLDNQGIVNSEQKQEFLKLLINNLYNNNNIAESFNQAIKEELNTESDEDYFLAFHRLMEKNFPR